MSSRSRNLAERAAAWLRLARPRRTERSIPRLVGPGAGAVAAAAAEPELQEPAVAELLPRPAACK